MAKITEIELVVEDYRCSFPLEQADELLRLKINGGWKLPEDSEWGWTPEKGFEKKGKKAASNAAAIDEGTGSENAASNASAIDEGEG